MPSKMRRTTGQIHLRLNPALYARLSRHAERSQPRVTLTALVECLCEKGLREMEESKKSG